ncbi:hypothetical protein PHYPSEUDO_000122 [Phytophthora pseudosyringae]|uniref:Uncharacterized protein n=1 Tax=Phytophthora pseudosyringae TaxID=221518 RepID=A0A8T1WKX5_9STRA|nr:hypothetical protein PHYPSEUDO_000122 [Phytophthora pseudosyringae]
MSEEVFRVLDQVAARGPRGPGRRPGTSSAASVGAVPPGSNVAAEDTESECEEEPDRENPNRVGEAGARVHPAPGHDRKTALLASTMRTAGEVQSFIVDAYKAQLLLQEAGAQRGATEDQIIARRTRLHAQRETNLKELGSVMRFQVTESTSNVRE